MDAQHLNRRLGIVLATYLLTLTSSAVFLLFAIFPTMDAQGEMVFPYSLGNPDQQLILLALTSGIAGSFIHTGQSLSTYIGNAQFKPSWATWYFMRPWIGGMLGLAIYLALRAGFVAGASFVNPYGVAALGLLGGWFSKTTADKLQEVFETLFTTNEDRKRHDKLQPDTSHGDSNTRGTGSSTNGATTTTPAAAA